MTPFDYWIREYPEILDFMMKYYKDNIERTAGTMKAKIQRMMDPDTPVVDKALALTALAYYKHFLD